MRILFLDNTATFGGAINSLGELLQALPADRFEPVVATAQAPDLLQERLPGVRTLRVPAMTWSGSGSDPSLLPTLKGLLTETLPEATRIAAIARKERMDILHLNNNLESQEAGALAAKLAGIPCVAHARSFQTPTRSLTLTARLVDRHLAVSRAVASNLEEIGANRERVHVVHDGIDPDRFAQVPDPSECRGQLGIPESVPAFGFFGRIIPWKGVKEFVLAACQVLDSRPEAHAVVVGDPSDGEASYAEDIRRIVADSGHGERLHLLGYRPDVRPLMAGLDLIVHASTSPEPFGMVIIEAMALEKPVVATRGGGPEDIVVPEETGLLVDGGVVPQLRDAVLAILDQPEQARAMGRKGRKRMETLFSSSLYAHRTGKIYDEILATGGRRTDARA